MIDPLSGKLASVPVEDEEISPSEVRAVAESIEWLKHNRAIVHEEVLAEFGLTMDDFREMGETAAPSESLPTSKEDRMDRQRQS